MLQQFVDMPSSITPMHSKLTLVPMHSNMSLDSPLVLQYMVRQPAALTDGRQVIKGGMPMLHTGHSELYLRLEDLAFLDSDRTSSAAAHATCPRQQQPLVLGLEENVPARVHCSPCIHGLPMGLNDVFWRQKAPVFWDVDLYLLVCIMIEDLDPMRRDAAL